MRDSGSLGPHNCSRVDMIPRSNAMPAILRAGLLAGLLDITAAYGVAVYFFMQLVVIPLSAIGARPLALHDVLVGVAIHIPCVGLPIALTLRRYTARNRLADVPRAGEA